jgi:hypothetical protein
MEVSNLKSASLQQIGRSLLARLSAVIEANIGFWPRTTERHVQLS